MKTIAFITLMMFGAATGFAQEDVHQKKDDKKQLTVEERADKRTEKMTELLALTDDQVIEVQKVNLKFATEMEALKAEQDALREKKKNLHENTKADFDKILTAEQKAIMEAKHEEVKNKREEKRKECKH